MSILRLERRGERLVTLGLWSLDRHELSAVIDTSLSEEAGERLFRDVAGYVVSAARCLMRAKSWWN
jgi:hypothetical protein